MTIKALTPRETPTDRLRELANDWEFYARLGVPETRRAMQRAVVRELETEVSRMREECKIVSPPRARLFPSFRRNAR